MEGGRRRWKNKTEGRGIVAPIMNDALASNASTSSMLR